MTTLDAALALLTAVCAVEWLGAARRARMALDLFEDMAGTTKKALDAMQSVRRQLAAYRVWL